jgi:hypothetical protein
MSSGIVHYKYYKKGYKYVLPISALFAFYDWKFSLGFLVGYLMGRWCDP